VLKASTRAGVEAVRTQQLLRHYRSNTESSLAHIHTPSTPSTHTSTTPSTHTPTHPETAMSHLAQRVVDTAVSVGLDLHGTHSTHGTHQARVLDVGCGPGGLSFAFAALLPHARVLGFDHR
jgi:2-polyprenyl-3-methyl-5-hydroxy-6-metoxy-1,4-benzoquinol methylase